MGNRRKYCSLACSKRENQRKYAEAHPERVRASQQSWADTNREKVRDYRRDYQQKWRSGTVGNYDAEKYRKQSREHIAEVRAANPEEARKKVRQYRAANKQRLLSKRREREGSMPRDKYLARMRKPQKPGRQIGRLSQDTDARITVVADCMLHAMNIWKLAPQAYPMQNDRDAAFRAAQKFVRRNAAAIAQRKHYLSGISPSERERAVEAALSAIK
jgi:hypothetical protein